MDTGEENRCRTVFWPERQVWDAGRWFELECYRPWQKVWRGWLPPCDVPVVEIPLLTLGRSLIRFEFDIVSNLCNGADILQEIPCSSFFEKVKGSLRWFGFQGTLEIFVPSDMEYPVLPNCYLVHINLRPSIFDLNSTPLNSDYHAALRASHSPPFRAEQESHLNHSFDSYLVLHLHPA